jgi:hypothetical protein
MDWSIPIAVILIVVFIRSGNKNNAVKIRQMELSQQKNLFLIHSLEENIRDLRAYVYKINLKQREYENEKDKREQAQQEGNDAG